VAVMPSLPSSVAWYLPALWSKPRYSADRSDLKRSIGRQRWANNYHPASNQAETNAFARALLSML